MKSKLLKDISHFLGVLMAVVLVMTYTSCSDEDTTDTTGFALYYLGMTDMSIYERDHFRAFLQRERSFRFYNHKHHIKR